MKAVFMDYYGTITYENGPIAMEIVKRVYKNSDAETPEAVLRYWWKVFRERLDCAYGANFHTQHEVALETFKDLVRHFHASENPEALLEKMEQHWRTTEIYADAKQFMREVRLPVYFVTNSDDQYVYASLENHDLHPAGVITSEQARYSKPRKEIFLYALERLGFKPEEVIHVGDSLKGDVECPAMAGIKSIWVNREGKPAPEGVVSVNSLMEVLDYVNQPG